MKRYRLTSLCLGLSLILASFSPVLNVPQPGALAQDLSPDESLSPEAVPILTCTGTGIGGDQAALRGIRFTVSQGFNAVEARFDGSAAGTYYFSAELRRSTGFLGNPIATSTVSVALPGTHSQTPYKPVRFTFPGVSVSGTETFTVKFTGFDGPGILYFETFGIGNSPCPGLEETDENNVANPTVRGDPAGFKVLAPSPSSFSLTSTFASRPPTIDGKLDFDEWNYSNRLPFDNGFISVMNDGVRLYVLLDVLGDNIEDIRNQDYFWVVFDVNRNGAINSNQDLLYGLDPNSNMRYSYFLAPNQWTSLQPNTYSSRARGFNCFWSDGTFTLKSRLPLQSTCSKHQVWELAFDLAEIGSSAPGSARMGVRVASAAPDFLNEIPANIGSDFSNLINITLAGPPTAIPTPPSGASVAFDSKPIEVTQAIQNRDNTLPLVKDKSSVARVYARTTGATSAQNLKAYLYGSRGGIDLPGSPLATMYRAPITIDRNQLSHTANFLLPSTWDEGSVTFSARAVNYAGQSAATGSQTLSFTAKSIPTYWIIPLNTGTNASPVLATQNQMDRQVSFLKTVFPLANVNIVQKPWTVIGPTTVSNAIPALNSYYNSSALAWVLSVIFTGKAPYTLPDQVYGFHTGGGGISDPVWLGGAGRVARGGAGAETIIYAHEINHNLDRSSNGTWGRHVNVSSTGCGASGPDPSWPYSNSTANEVGFDTRLPWSGTGTTLTVVSNATPDFMSYCTTTLVSPQAWISPYRWQNQFTNFTTVAHTASLEQIQEIQEVYYISGSISRDPLRGGLDPILVQPGIPTSMIPTGEYSIEIQDKGGLPISITPFKIEFLDDPKEPVNTVYFNFQIPVLNPDFNVVGKIFLKHGQEVLDQIIVSNSPPSVNILKPSGGETWSGIQTVQWEASDPDGDPLSFTILYSPNSGLNWFPVASSVEGNSLLVNVSALPGGAQAIFRVIATDGFNNAQDDSALFAISDNPPVVYITSPESGTVIPSGNPAHLSGEADDPEDEFLPDEAFVWTEGESVVGVGREATANLSPGWHTITLNVVDSQGNTGVSSIEILVGGRIFLPSVNRSIP